MFEFVFICSFLCVLGIRFDRGIGRMQSTEESLIHVPAWWFVTICVFCTGLTVPATCLDKSMSLAKISYESTKTTILIFPLNLGSWKGNNCVSLNVFWLRWLVLRNTRIWKLVLRLLRTQSPRLYTGNTRPFVGDCRVPRSRLGWWLTGVVTQQLDENPKQILVVPGNGTRGRAYLESTINRFNRH